MSLLSPQLQAFLAVSQLKTVHGAAKTLGITQTGVTQRLRALETTLATTLFIRSRRGMLLTEEGEVLFRYCLSARELEAPALAKILGAGKRKEIRVGITGPTSILRTRVIPPCMGLLKDFPDLLFHFKISDTERGVEDLRDGSAQFAILRPENTPKDLDTKLLRPERYVLVGPEAWKKRPIREVVGTERIIDFDPEDRTSFDYLRACRLLERVNSERHFVNNNEALAAMIEAGHGYGVFTLEFAEQFLKRCKIAILNATVFERPQALAWYPRSVSSEYWTRTVRAIR
jgi:LysR family transcriptional regulator (chromosome initiation inhibitor)